MSNQHPITPPPELVMQWWDRTLLGDFHEFESIATQAARWGADQELETCCDWLIEHGYDIASPELRAACRHKPPTLKEQALAELEILRIDANTHGLGFDAPAIRRALEALPNN